MITDYELRRIMESHPGTTLALISAELLNVRRAAGGQEKPTDIHKPFTDDGVTYCGWDGHEGCGELWPCSTVRAAAPVGGQAEPSDLIEESRETEWHGLFHPAWPDPLGLRDRADAERWYAEHVERHPGIALLARDVIRYKLLRPAAAVSGEQATPPSEGEGWHDGDRITVGVVPMTRVDGRWRCDGPTCEEGGHSDDDVDSEAKRGYFEVTARGPAGVGGQSAEGGQQ